MRTFSEYIGQASLLESRQNYIFGGTDDRNTDETSKTFGDLEEGDYLFWSDPISKKGERVRIHKRAISNIERIKGMHIYTLRPFGEHVVPNIYIEDRYYVNDFKNCKMVYATNIDDFLKIVNDFSGVTHTEDNIILVEANQNYIFGGTDDRNTEIKVKSFRDLEKGDVIYEFDSETEKAYERIFQELKIDATATIKTINAFGFEDSYIIDKDALDDSFYIFQKIHCLATTEEEMIDIAKKEFGVKLGDEDIARL